ncbi:ABC transporter ATP-binding protein [Nitrospina watsonii]|uniref:Dipeptide ABC transporter ATP binding subunit DppD n=1 Tax=Nitrospina watsonii TaxID=1323948 RepID=A0ABM9HF20_9BACT|nr:ABC transporter ATP-binding protein [Nitrospina watsonii]CAI2718635.1 dipeptide ABC transporter ATP binding subunit DppD [Nitrospina watsonii]
MAPLLKIEDLVTSFFIEEGRVQSVRQVSLQIEKGETVALVGESGCGKSVTALSVMRLVPTPPGRYESGRITFDKHDIFALSEDEMRDIRGNDIGMIFQEPMTSLNPIFTIGDQIIEAIVLHQNKSGAEARKLALELLDRVRIPSPEQRIDQYPHELSGGMKQRVMIAMAISCQPALLIADEPTTALDVTIEAQILDVLAKLRDETKMSVLLITHNLGIVAQFADRVAVMYAGKIVEEAPVIELFEDPKHPYTRGLLRSLPRDEPGQPLEPIGGTVPNPVNLPSGCAFHPRCPDVMDECSQKIPPAYRTGPKQTAACYLYKTNTVASES